MESMEVSSPQHDELKAWLHIPEGQPKSWVQALDPKAYVSEFWEKNTRPDGRMFSQARPTKVVFSLFKNSTGSALVKQGDTKVMAATTLQIGQPSSEFPGHGDVVVSVTTPDESHADRLQSWLQRMLDDLLPPQLSLVKGQCCIRLMVTVIIMQDSGNLMDTSLLACMSAWKDTKLPTMESFAEVEGKLWWKETPTTSLDKVDAQEEERDYRISLTMGVLEGENGTSKFLVDPSDVEEEFVSGELTMVVTLSNRKGQLESFGDVPLTATDLALASKMANGRADELMELLR